MTIIGLKELRQNSRDIAERASNGEHFTVVRRSKPVFNITPIIEKPPSNKELSDWAYNAINKYRPALEALNKK